MKTEIKKTARRSLRRCPKCRPGSAFIVFCKQEFQVEEPDILTGLPVHFKLDAGNMIGYLPVYATRKDAETDYPGHRIEEIREVRQ